jgi:hypothetical protein
MLRMDEVWHPRMGAPLGNRNRLTHGDQTNAVKALYRLIAQWRRETQALLARAVSELAVEASPDTLVVGRKNIHRSTAGQSCIV